MQSMVRFGTSSQQAHSRKKDTYLNNLNLRLRESLKSIQENFEMMLSRAKLENQAILCRCDPYSLVTQENFEYNVRAANIVNACEGITRLVSEIKLLLILGDFRWLETSVNEEAEERECRFSDLMEVTSRLCESISRDLVSLEEVLGCTPRRPRDQTISSESNFENNAFKFRPLN
ncbi:unnamed protein product [Hymenolepis diminuta]|uniref:Mediator of RNA polymerase II transcription subunit 22 n=1 Tax=Hymenolepis diminuta TaxID=6216 RepID=A0A564Y9U8_HYMDI|nr:unnamed protein product [Hymenolepis diminuta]